MILSACCIRCKSVFDRPAVFAAAGFAAARALLAVTLFFLARAAVSFSPFLILALKTSGFCVRVSREVVLYEALIFPL
jgi:hypothetical protein